MKIELEKRWWHKWQTVTHTRAKWKIKMMCSDETEARREWNESKRMSKKNCDAQAKITLKRIEWNCRQYGIRVRVLHRCSCCSRCSKNWLISMSSGKKSHFAKWNVYREIITMRSLLNALQICMSTPNTKLVNEYEEGRGKESRMKCIFYEWADLKKTPQQNRRMHLWHVSENTYSLVMMRLFAMHTHY